MVSLLLCLLDWCMAIPLSLLLEPITMPSLEDRTSHKAPLLDYIYRVGSLTGNWEVGKAESFSYDKHFADVTDGHFLITDCYPISSETCIFYTHTSLPSDTITSALTPSPPPHQMGLPL